MSTTIQQTIDVLRQTLTSYIEATYHIAHPSLVAQRRALLAQVGGIYQAPFLESTPRYMSTVPYTQIDDIPPAALDAYRLLSDGASGKPVLFERPYTHQHKAMRDVLTHHRNLMIMTGTGSGKTESFLLPILGKLAIEAKEHPTAFAKYHAVRALVLYPMNALVNDQLGRLRQMFGDPRVVKMFESLAGRPALFARYTSRTPYAGLRNSGKDGARLSSIGDFFGEIEDAKREFEAGGNTDAQHTRAAELFAALQARGKWPAKPSVSDWLGKAPTHWVKRARRLPHDAELLTRHEAQVSPPDLLITNYSMLEYMMMRPIERPIFDATRTWLKERPDEKILVVLDEAHLYRGAQGAEVGLLLRRLRERLGVGEERFQVICATASFSEEGKKVAGKFGAQLTGAKENSFEPVLGDLALRTPASVGGAEDAAALAAVDMQKFYAEAEADQRAAVEPFLAYRKQTGSEPVGVLLYRALEGFAPFNQLVNETMKAAISLAELPNVAFAPGTPKADVAIGALLALGSRAKLKPEDPSLLPCRIHTFFRGLPGLWICTDAECTELTPEEKGPAGKLYAQPRERCGCGAPVLEYFTCRYCGTSYARAYTNDVANPRYLWAESGKRLETAAGVVESIHPLDLLLEEPPEDTTARPVFYDLVTGQIDPDIRSDRGRTVYLQPKPGVSAGQQPNQGGARPGQFAPCPCCDRIAGFGASSVQDHQTKGDQPFHALLASQLKIQPPSPKPASSFAPLRGRKVLIFSDSRQMAARLAPTLQTYSLRDTVRALLPLGFNILAVDEQLKGTLSLDNSYLAVALAAHRYGVRLRPELMSGETLIEFPGASPGPVPQGAALIPHLITRCPVQLRDAIVGAIKNNDLGLEALAIATVAEGATHTAKFAALPDLPGVATNADAKLAVVRAWIRCWALDPGVWYFDMPLEWWGTKVTSHKGKFDAMNRVLVTPHARTVFNKHWLPILLQALTLTQSGATRIMAAQLTLQIGGAWRRCPTCTSVHRPIGQVATCIDCGSPDVHTFDPDTDEVYNARKRFYREPVAAALAADEPQLMTIIAAEHTAQLGAAQPDKAFSHAEDHEIRFQDIEVAWRDSERPGEPAIDVLSSTTTMEVGIDIGELSGVALRNMPPGRANYQQRAGRAGRRGNAVATVVAFGSADSHDDHYFTEPWEMIRGSVIDPRLTLENAEIARRHLRAYLLQRYHEDKIPGVDPGADPNLFSVLGKVGDFRTDGSLLNRKDFAAWLKKNQRALAEAADRWLPRELSPADRKDLIDNMGADALEAVDAAINYDPTTEAATPPEAGGVGEEASEGDDEEIIEVGDENKLVDPATDKLLDRLLHQGVIPRYAFPTDVVAFHVLNPNTSTAFRNQIEFAPTQGLTLALSQYAPNKQIWIKNNQYTCKAVYSPYPGERRRAWGKRELYFECTVCSHAATDAYSDARRNTTENCPACQSATFGPARVWFRPTGFAHLIDRPPTNQPDQPNETAFATRAKLVMQTPGRDKPFVAVAARVRAYPAREFLLVSNTGPDQDGYNYCLECGRIEAVADMEENIFQPHARPYRSDEEGLCQGPTASHVVLGTDFRTDIALFSLPLDAPFRAAPGSDEAASALRTVCEALAKAACNLLEIEAGEILAEFRPALNDAGARGEEAEVFLYDTLAGGAGFSTQLVDRGPALFKEAMRILTTCPDACDASCYRCLRSFRNKLEHGLLDRQLGAQFLEHAMRGGYPAYPADRTERSLDLFVADLRRQFSAEFTFERNAARTDAAAGSITVPIVAIRRSSNAETWVCLSSPLAAAVPTDPAMQGLSAAGRAKIECADDLVVRFNLPEASLALHSALR